MFVAIEIGTIERISRVFQRSMRHPQYSARSVKNDIALIELDADVDFNDNVRPACIFTDVRDLPENRELIIAGWGSIEADSKRSEFIWIFNYFPKKRINSLFILINNSLFFSGTNQSEVLLKANVTTVPIQRCNQTLLEYNQLSNLPSLRGLAESQVCAINLVDKRDACQGKLLSPHVHHLYLFFYS